MLRRTRSTHRRGLVTIAVALSTAVLLAACASQAPEDSGASPEEGEPQVGGSLVFGAEQEPAGLNTNLVCCTLAWGTWIINQVIEGAYEVQPDFSYKPDLIESDPEITDDPFTLTYQIREEAAWSDGTPVSAEDFEFTWKTWVDPDVTIASRTGYEIIEKAEIIDDKTIKFTFEEPYAGWRDLFGPVLPKHALEGENFNKVWNKAIVNPKTGEPIASGPFLFEEWKKGSELTLVRNEEYWGEHTAYLDKIVWRFIPETNAEIQALRGGEVEAIYPQPQLELVPLFNQQGLEIEVNPGTTWEHLDIQVGDNGHPALRHQYVREALAMAIDREGLVAQLFRDLMPDLGALHNLMYVGNHPDYVPNWEKWEHDPQGTTALLEDNGCTKGADGIYECDGERLSFGFTSTSGNALRELAFQVIQQQLKLAGIEVKSEFGDAAVVFGDKVLVQGNYDLFMFAWVGTPDPQGNVEIFKCRGSQNFTGHCNEEASELLEQSSNELDEEARAALMNRADELLSIDIPVIPLYQKPTFLAYNTKLHNMIDNSTAEGFAWNADEWWIEE